MPALVQYGFEEFTGPNIGQLDRLPVFIPVSGYDRRFYAQHFSNFLDGTVVREWPDTEVSKVVLTTADSGITGATMPVLGTRSSHRVVRFNGVKDSLGSRYLNGEPFTFTIVFYQPAPAADKFMVSTSDTTGLASLYLNDTGAPTFRGTSRVKAASPLAAGWHVITLVASGTSSRIRVDDDTAFTVEAGGAYVRNRLTLGASTFNSNNAAFDVAELVHWPSALTAAEVANVHASFKGRYGI